MLKKLSIVLLVTVAWYAHGSTQACQASNDVTSSRSDQNNSITGHPATIIIIRHGEKQGGEAKVSRKDVPSVHTLYQGTISAHDVHGIAKDIHAAHYKVTKDVLSQPGRERAAALAPYFKGRPEIKDYMPEKPAAIFAKKPSKKSPSIRPIQTIAPTAAAFDMPINAVYDDFKVEELAKDIQKHRDYDGKVVLICWEHHQIPNLIKAINNTFKTNFELPKAMNPWPDDVYDRTEILDFHKKKLVNFPQKLMFGDSKE